MHATNNLKAKIFGYMVNLCLCHWLFLAEPEMQCNWHQLIIVMSSCFLFGHLQTSGIYRDPDGQDGKHMKGNGLRCSNKSQNTPFSSAALSLDSEAYVEFGPHRICNHIIQAFQMQLWTCGRCWSVIPGSNDKWGIGKEREGMICIDSFQELD